MSISIHALREEGDLWDALRDAARDNFYPRPPRGGRRERYAENKAAYQFLSTPSARRATGPAGAPPRTLPISIHALREEGDRRTGASSKKPHYFYPRPPRGGRPACASVEAVEAVISIHALREEGDEFVPFYRLSWCDFYPRPPRGGRLALPDLQRQGNNFYPRPPRGGRPEDQAQRRVEQGISIHALREEGDARPTTACRSSWISIHALREEGDTARQFLRRDSSGFLSTPSARRATGTVIRMDGVSCNFYPRPPRGGRPAPRSCRCRVQTISIHALREEGDRKILGKKSPQTPFLSTPSARRATAAVR